MHVSRKVPGDHLPSARRKPPKTFVGGFQSPPPPPTHPSTVRQMLMRRSAPQPAIMKTPTGGTTDSLGNGSRKRDGIWKRGMHTDDGDENDEEGRNGVGACHDVGFMRNLGVSLRS